jgi:O-antigen/teichoic acid export membrane protein
MKRFFDKFPEKSFTRNFVVLLSSSLLVSLIAMGTSIYIARILSPVRYGEYAVVLSVIGMFQVFASMGLSATITKEVARNQDKSKAIFSTSLKAFAVGFVMAVLFLCFYVSFGSQIKSEFIVILIVLSLFTQSIWCLFESVAFGMQRMEYSGLINLILTSSLFLIYLLISKESITVEIVLLCNVMSSLFKNIIYYYIINKKGLLTGELIGSDAAMTRVIQMIKVSFPFLVMGFFSMISNQLPILFLSANSGSEQVAYFNTANKLLLPIDLFISTAMTAMFPNLSKLYHSDKELFKEKVRMGLTAISVLGIIGAITVSFFSKQIVSFIYGDLYSDTGLVMVYQCWFTLGFALFCFFGSILSSADKQKTLSYLSVLYAVVSVPILWIGSHYGAVYLSLAFLSTAIINMTYHWYYIQKILPSPFVNYFTLKLFSLIIVSFVVSFLIPGSLSLFNSFLIYILIICSILFVVKKDISVLLKSRFNVNYN